jgi:hypothetical protein
MPPPRGDTDDRQTIDRLRERMCGMTACLRRGQDAGDRLSFPLDVRSLIGCDTRVVHEDVDRPSFNPTRGALQSALRDVARDPMWPVHAGCRRLLLRRQIEDGDTGTMLTNIVPALPMPRAGRLR